MPGSRDDWFSRKEDRHEQRLKLIDKLRREDADDLADRLTRCGQEITLVCTCCGARKKSFTHCDLKWCPACQHHLAAQTAERFARIISAAHIAWPLNVTLTAKNFGYDEPWPIREVRRNGQTRRECVNPIRWIRNVAWSERLRRLDWFRSKVKGGVIGFEVTDQGNGYHVHAHCLLDCKWLSVTQTAPPRGASKEQVAKRGDRACKEVGAQWELCCQRPASCKVRRVWTRENDIQDALREVVKYSVKGSDLVESKREAAPLIRLLDGCRMITSFGSMFGRPECKRVKGTAPPCESCGVKGATMPEAIVLGTARDEHGNHSPHRRR